MACQYGDRCQKRALETYCNARGITMPVHICHYGHPKDLTLEQARRFLIENCRRVDWLRKEVAKDATLYKELIAPTDEGRYECRFGSRCTRRALNVICDSAGVECPCDPCDLPHKNGDLALQDAREALLHALECPKNGKTYRAHLEKNAPAALTALGITDVVRPARGQGRAIRRPPTTTINNMTVTGDHTTVNFGA